MARVFAVAVALSAVLFVAFALPQPQEEATTQAPGYATGMPGMTQPPSNMTGGYTAPPANPPAQNGSYGQPEMTPPPNGNYSMPGMPGR